ncbi:MAG: uroporphyrinogen-III C-methyltransferase [Mariprofundales bacterium]
MQLDTPLQNGEVALVGSGPGDPSLLTLAAARLLADCDVVIYDALVSADALELVTPTAELVFAGKRGGRPSSTQQDICHRLVQLSQAGKRIVRLKGGTSCIFGRGGEEMRALYAANIKFRIIPGITAGIAAAEMAGIALTDRHNNATLAFLTGREADDASRIDWLALITAFPVLVLYMSAATLSAVAKKLLAAGLLASTPVAIIHKATLANEIINIGTLSQASTGDLQAISPSIVIIGEAVQNRINWQE